MKNEEFRLITQIGIVVPDLEAAMEKMEKAFGARPDMFCDTPKDGKFYYGEPEDFSCRMAFYRFANVELELIVPLKGRSIWKDFLNAGKVGIHHIRFNVTSYEGAVREMEARGYKIIMESKTARNIEGLKWGYFDTEKDLGFVVEILNDLEVEPGVADRGRERGEEEYHA